ncbi:ninein-like protein isoform X4 [Moschus berezovskii]|uniref:ninein-like protein isoform X4 n=1 Tax=Moschus berezovskii TaxID=68408 RepID=UPI002443CAE8|nr:ninein-like protein isoform X4 [Moschus berezovskii]
MELRIKDLESELSKMKTLREDSNKAELEKYKQLYLVECEVRKSLQDKLDKTNERLAEMSTKLEVEKQQNGSLFSPLSRRPVLEPSSVGNFNPTSGFNANLISRANVGFSTSIPRPSNDSMETYLTKDLQDRNNELQAALEGLQAQTAPSRRGRLPPGHGPAGTVMFMGDSAPASIKTEITLEQLKEHHQEFKIQLETKVNGHKRDMEVMKRAFAEERRKLERAFQLKVGMLQGQKAKLATLHTESQEVDRGLREELHRRGKLERGHVRWLSPETARLQEALQLHRIKLEKCSEECTLLKNELGRSRQELEASERRQAAQRKEMEDLKRDEENACSEMQGLCTQNGKRVWETWCLKESEEP